MDEWILYCRTLKTFKIKKWKEQSRDRGIWRRRPALGCSANEEEEEY
jgi:hypothetical protein